MATRKERRTPQTPKEYVLKIRTSKNRNIHKSEIAQKTIERYLKLALGCDVQILFTKEVISYEKVKSNHN